MHLTLLTSVQYVPRVGPAMAGKLDRMGIHTVRDLLFHIPFRYNDFSHTVPIGRVVAGTTVTIEGDLQSIKNVFTKNGKKIQQAVVRDETGMITIVWFNQLYLPKVLAIGDHLFLSGKIGFFGNSLVMESPEYERHMEDGGETLHTGRFVPVYPETAGVTSKWLRGRIAFLLSQLDSFLTDPVPTQLLTEYHLQTLLSALQKVHFPTSLLEAETARHRLAFDELLELQLTSRVKKMRWEKDTTAPVLKATEKDILLFLKHLPFTLTHDQEKAIRHIMGDLAGSIPMNRLLEGDVGSGKTVVAACAMYIAYIHGYTSVMMAPTQILAEQHFSTIRQLLEPFGIPVQLILGGSKQKNPKSANNSQLATRNSELTIYIGTHALLQKSLTLKKVGLVVVDEQQRFGVAQRTIIREKGATSLTPHFLTMTATPIPRTLALTLYGNLDLSLLSELPKGRIPIKTWVVPKTKRQSAYAWIRKNIKETGCRVFIVCPFIDESESMQSIKAVTKEYETLSHDVFPDIPMGILHGRMKSKEKTETLDRVRNGKTNILVTTPVVEVGIDIPEASIIVIEGADRFGLSQLHQLRGRVGRGTLSSYCLLYTETDDAKVMERLKIMEKVKDGPTLAEYDLTLRGEGDILGMRQHGLPPLTLASLRDRALVEKTEEAAKKLLHEDPELSQFPLLRDQVEKGIISEGIQD